MKNKGFTLIELLAVIVVLAVIALIATPIVLNTIDEARAGAAQSSTYAYVDEVEKELASYMINNSGNNYATGKHSVETLKTDLGIELKGDTPTVGNVCIGDNGTITKASIKINNYVVSYDGKNAITTDAEEIEDITCPVPILDKAKTLVYDESGVCKTDGSTYQYMNGCYIKGASTNNYVWYNGFMWRIMGINSDNTVRLITDENVTALAYGDGVDNTALTYESNEGYIHDWLNDYFFSNLNNTKSIIQEGAYFCSESTNEVKITEGRTTCTEGNEVTTKVGLMAIDEYMLSGTLSSYLNMEITSYTMTPYKISSAWYESSSGNANTVVVTAAYGVRPVINVNSNSFITEGDGTTSNFYVLGEDKSTSITGNLSDKVTSGEYVSLEGKTYRVVRKETDGIKLILDGYYEKTEGTSYTMKYNETTGDNVFVLTSGIGAKLNGDVLNWLGLSNSDKIVETTYFQGDGFGVGTNYHDVLKKSNGVKCKVGLIQIGDILASQSSTILTKNYTIASNYNNAKVYWTLSKEVSDSSTWWINNKGNANSVSVIYPYSIRPVIKVRNDLTITGGNGTWTSPYQI